MAWNPSPEVQVARDAAQRLGELSKARTAMCVVLCLMCAFYTFTWSRGAWNHWLKVEPTGTPRVFNEDGRQRPAGWGWGR